MHITTDKSVLKIGILSDTHGLMREQIYSHFTHCDFLLHAGDIGSPSILTALSKIAPVYAVLGNTDSTWVYPELRDTVFFETPQCMLCVTHDCKALDFEPATCDINCIICGHTHIPQIHERDSILYINPGSAGPKRFELPISIAILSISGKKLDAQIIYLQAS
jgi:putative phosphoesterase